MIWRKWNSTVFCFVGLHRACSGHANSRDGFSSSLCACRCHDLAACPPPEEEK